MSRLYVAIYVLIPCQIPPWGQYLTSCQGNLPDPVGCV